MSGPFLESEASVLTCIDDLQNRAIWEGLRVVLRSDKPDFDQASTTDALQALRVAGKILQVALSTLDDRADKLEAVIAKPRP